MAEEALDGLDLSVGVGDAYDDDEYDHALLQSLNITAAELQSTASVLSRLYALPEETYADTSFKHVRAALDPFLARYKRTIIENIEDSIRKRGRVVMICCCTIT